MLYLAVLNIILFLCRVDTSDENEDDEDLGANLISQLKNEANLDLSVDEEYEDLRAELLAYHSALASLTSGRRSMLSTPCWELGGICVNHKLCAGFRYLTQVPGCRDKLKVCCFTWNRYRVRDMRDKGLGPLALPWSQQYVYGGAGVKKQTKRPKKLKKNITNNIKR